MARLLAILVWLCVAAAAQAEPPKNVFGPVYPDSHLRSLHIYGARLGMSLHEAGDALVSAGFRKRFDHKYDNPLGQAADGNALYITDRYGESVTLSYVVLGDGEPVVSGIHYMEPASLPEAQADAWRERVTGRYGQPSDWMKWLHDGVIGDRFAYVTSTRLKRDDARQQLRSCAVDWAGERLDDSVDCRDILKAARTPVLTVSFVSGAVSYELDDYRLAYRSLLRSRAFRNLDTRGAVRLLHSVH